MVNLSASDEVLMKPYHRKRLIANKTSRTGCAYVFCSCGYGESTQDVVFSGTSLIFENGTLLAEGERFSMEPTMILSDVDIQKVHTLRQKDNTFAVVTPDGACTSDYAKLYSIVKWARLQKQTSKKLSTAMWSRILLCLLATTTR